MKVLKVLGIIVAIPVAIVLLLMAYGAFLTKFTDNTPSPKDISRAAIAQCWVNQKDPALTPSSQL